MAKHNGAKRPKKRGGKFFPALCNILGTILMLSVVALLLPATIAQARGYDVYNIVSGSMEPEIPVGSLIVVKPVDWHSILEDDIIAYYSNGTVVCHRVETVRGFEGDFITKGDANDSTDINTVPFDSLIGLVVQHVAYLGQFTAYAATTLGKVYLAGVLLCGVLFNILARRLREG